MVRRWPDWCWCSRHCLAGGRGHRRTTIPARTLSVTALAAIPAMKGLGLRALPCTPMRILNGSGKLGVVVSSARYKRDIKDMGTTTDGLMKLRPVTFAYKGDEQGVKQHGLVAEEVEKVYPELVVHDGAGQVESVR